MRLKHIIILSIITLFFASCSDNKTSQKGENKAKVSTKVETNSLVNKKPSNKIIIKINDINITFNKNLIIYPKKRVFLLFCKDSTFCKMQEAVLKDLNVTYYKTNNEYLKHYFHINIDPTIIVLDINKTIRYENFVPYEILKAEGY